MRRVIVESPWRGDTARNLRYLRACLLDCYERGEAPIASHAIGTQCLPETDEGRRLGIGAGLAWIPVADAVICYEDLGVTPSMESAARLGALHGLACEVRRLGAERERLEQEADQAARSQGWGGSVPLTLATRILEGSHQMGALFLRGEEQRVRDRVRPGLVGPAGCGHLAHDDPRAGRAGLCPDCGAVLGAGK